MTQISDQLTGRYCDIIRPAVAAHRGASMRYPENSMAAFKEAINIAMHHPEIRFFIEMDVRATKDGVLVLMHDSDVSRTTNGQGFVEEMTFAQVQRLHTRSVAEIAGRKYVSYERASPSFFPISEQDFRAPTLEEVIGIVREANRARGDTGSPIGLALDIKPKPPIHLFSRWVEPLAGILSAVLDKLRLRTMAENVMPATSSIVPLAHLLNVQSLDDHTPPILVFSTAGAVGKRDLNQLWHYLAPDTKLEMMHQSGKDRKSLPCIANDLAKAFALNAPHHAPFVDLHNSPVVNATQRTAEKLKHFSLIGSLKPHKDEAKEISPTGITVKTHVKPLDEAEEIRSALRNGSTLIATNYPERAIAVLHECFSVVANTGHRVLEPARQPDGHFVQQEMQRREQSPAMHEML